MKRAALVAAVLATVLFPVAAEADWEYSGYVGGKPIVGPNIGVADDGESVIQWHQTGSVVACVRTFEQEGCDWRRRIGGKADYNDVVVAGSGDAVSIWRGREKRHPVWAAVRRARDKGFGKRVLVARRSTSAPSAAIDSKGRFAIAWVQGKGARSVIRLQSGRGGKFGSKRTISSRRATLPVVDMNDNGATGIVWVQKAAGGRRGRIVARTRRRATAPWLAPETLSDRRRNSDTPGIAMSAGGAGMVTWRTSGAARSEVWAGDAEGAAPAERLSDPAVHSGDPVVDVSDDGEATVAWVAGPRNQQGWFFGDVLVSTRVAGGETFGGVRKLNGDPFGGGNWITEIDVNPRGDAAVLWTYTEGGELPANHQFASVRPAGGEFAAEERVDGPVDEGFGGDVGLDAAGNGVAAFDDGDQFTMTATRRAGS